jgi:uncharacterized iron-regulated protein
MLILKVFLSFQFCFLKTQEVISVSSPPFNVEFINKDQNIDDDNIEEKINIIDKNLEKIMNFDDCIQEKDIQELVEIANNLQELINKKSNLNQNKIFKIKFNKFQKNQKNSLFFNCICKDKFKNNSELAKLNDKLEKFSDKL